MTVGCGLDKVSRVEGHVFRVSIVLCVFSGGPAIAIEVCQEELTLLVGIILEHDVLKGHACHGPAEPFARFGEGLLESKALFPPIGEQGVGVQDDFVVFAAYVVLKYMKFLRDLGGVGVSDVLVPHLLPNGTARRTWRGKDKNDKSLSRLRMYAFITRRTSERTARARGLRSDHLE